MSRIIFVIPFLFTVLSCDQSLPTENVCFSETVVPLIRRDCAACHTNGEYAVRLQGSTDDYDDMSQYIIGNDPNISPLLLWAAGLDEHPPIWSADSREHATVAAWISEGARATCGEPADADADADADIEDADIDEEDADNDSDVEADVEVDADIDEGPDLVSFADDISPRHRMSCRPCHYGGLTPPEINGDSGDYPLVITYVDKSDPEGVGGWLWHVSGGNPAHPISWPPGSPAYNLFLDWVLQGAEDN